MLTLEFPVNALILLAISAISMLIGFSYGRAQVLKIRKKLLKTETEMINSHAEILEMQKEYINMEIRLRAVKDPVIVMASTNEAAVKEKMPDGSLRKKMLAKDFSPGSKESHSRIYDNRLNKKIG